MVFTLFDQEQAIAGFSSLSGELVEREPGEALAALSARAWTIIGGYSMWAHYPRAVWEESEGVPFEVAALGRPKPEPVTPEATFPWHLSGIGREATPEELARMGIAPR